MKYLLESSNFKVGYKSYLNELHPDQDETGPSIFDVAVIIERSTKNILKKNKKLTPGINHDSLQLTTTISVATAKVGNGHACHAMVLDCILADIEKDDQGNTVFDSNGDKKLKNYSFKFKNTYRNEKEIEIKAGKIKPMLHRLCTNYIILGKYIITIIFDLDNYYSPTVFYYINIDFVPP